MEVLTRYSHSAFNFSSSCVEMTQGGNLHVACEALTGCPLDKRHGTSDT